MGGVSSTTTNPIDANNSQLPESSPTKSTSPNSSPSSSNSTTASSDVNTSNSQTHFSGSKTLEVETSTEAIGSSELKEDSNQSKKPTKENEDGEEVEGEEEEEEEGECPFCLFMKGGGCKDAFIAWEDCVQEAENNKEDIVEKCHEVTGALTKCMQAHADYYEPILRAEKAAKEEVMKEMDKEKGTNETESNAAESEIEILVDSRDYEGFSLGK